MSTISVGFEPGKPPLNKACILMFQDGSLAEGYLRKGEASTEVILAETDDDGYLKEFVYKHAVDRLVGYAELHDHSRAPDGQARKADESERPTAEVQVIYKGPGVCEEAPRSLLSSILNMVLGAGGIATVIGAIYGFFWAIGWFVSLVCAQFHLDAVQTFSFVPADTATYFGFSAGLGSVGFGFLFSCLLLFALGTVCVLILGGAGESVRKLLSSAKSAKRSTWHDGMAELPINE